MRKFENFQYFNVRNFGVISDHCQKLKVSEDSKEI